jgi:hypothetical protein
VPTEEELEAMIAEQMRPENLPSWWFADCERQRRQDRDDADEYRDDGAPDDTSGGE